MAVAGGFITVPYAAEETRTTAPGTFSAETITDTISVAVVAGKTYDITWLTQARSSVGTDAIGFQLRDTNVVGDQLWGITQDAPANHATCNALCFITVPYTAVGTGNKTFVGTMRRTAGSGVITATAGSGAPSRLSVREVI